VIQDFTFSVVFLCEIEAVLNPDLIQFGPKTGYSARNIGIVHETILSLRRSLLCCCNQEAITLRIPVPGILSVIEIFRQLTAQMAVEPQSLSRSSR
jgi:hypothetical protein